MDALLQTTSNLKEIVKIQAKVRGFLARKKNAIGNRNKDCLEP